MDNLDKQKHIKPIQSASCHFLIQNNPLAQAFSILVILVSIKNISL